MITIDTTIKNPAYMQIYEQIKNKIIDGTYSCNEKLSSSRALASQLNISRNTVDLAYAQLLSEGYILSVPKSGYYVNDIAGLIHISPKTLTNNSYITTNNSITYKYNFSPNEIDMTSFPYSIWKKLSKECLMKNDDLFLAGSYQGDEAFRTSIQSYLASSRNINCDISQIIVGAGVDYLLQLLCQILQSNKNFIPTIAFENPTYKRAYKIFKGFSYEINPISLDSNGINIKNLIDTQSNIVYVTPSHQYPLGIIMPLKRRLELINWSNMSENRYIIEDDHDSEFRYSSRPISSLASFDSNEKVIYIGTFSKSIAPAIRIAYMILPHKLLDIYHKNFNYYSCTVSRVDQAIITKFINDGYFQRHLNRMRKLYKSRHDTLKMELEAHPDKFEIISDNAGQYIVVKYIGKQYNDEQIKELVTQAGINLYFVSEYLISQTKESYKPLLMIGFGNISEDNIRDGINLLNQILE